MQALEHQNQERLEAGHIFYFLRKRRKVEAFYLIKGKNIPCVSLQGVYKVPLLFWIDTLKQQSRRPDVGDNLK
jgi:hypothetical protein